MKIEIKRLLNEQELNYYLKDVWINDYLKTATFFDVIGILYETNTIYYLVWYDSKIIQIPFLITEIVEEKIPIDWVISSKIGNIIIGPILLHEKDFFEKLSEGDQEIEAKFEDLLGKYFIK